MMIPHLSTAAIGAPITPAWRFILPHLPAGK